MDPYADFQLVERCQAGDTSAFDKLVRKHQSAVYRLVYRMLGGSSEADDVSQEIFLKAYRKIGGFHRQSSFLTWLTRIAINHCINYSRGKRASRFLPLGLFFNQRKTPEIEPQRDAEQAERSEKVLLAISALPPRQRTVIVLHYFEDYSYEDIADIMDCPVGTVKSRLFHARKRLKKRLEHYIEEGEWTDGTSKIGGEDYDMFKM